MPLDPSIILGAGQGVTPLQNPMDIASKAMAMQNLSMQNQQQRQSFQDEQALRSAYAQNTSVDANGNPSIDRQGIMKNLAQTSPSLVPKMAAQFQQTDIANLQAMHDKASMAADTLNGVNDEASYQAAKNSPFALANGSQNWPPNYDPSFVSHFLGKSLSVKDYAAQQAEQQGLKIKQQEADTAALGEKNKEKELGIQTQEAFGSGGSGPAPTTDAKGSPIDPSTLINRLPKSLQAKALEEQKDNASLAKIAGPSLDAFDRAAKEVRPLSGGFGVSGTAFIPGMESPGQKAFSGLANTTVKDVEGTARQAAFDSIQKNFRPQFGDSDSNIASKRAGWIQYLKSHAAAPTNMKGGIDLSQYPATSIDKAIPGSSYQPTPQEAAAELARRQQANQANR